MKRPRLAILRDFPEENWTSMDLVAEMLHRALCQEHADRLEVEMLCPPFRRRATRVSGTWRIAMQMDLLANRLRDYPKFARTLARKVDAFHVADHSYAALVHALPGDRTGVFCHDLDTFESLLDPKAHPRPRWFRLMSKHILSGMQKAAIVFYSSDDVGGQIRRHGLIDPARLVQARAGVAEEFSSLESDLGEIDPGVREAASGKFILHVGSCIRRKRIDVLLDVFAQLRARDSALRLIKVGGEWTAEQRAQIRGSNIEDHFSHFVGIDRHALAFLYRRAAAVLVTSESEGFGLPAIEALACGAPVVASDIPVLREIGGEAVMYCPVGEIEMWVRVIEEVMSSSTQGDREKRLARASLYSWSNHARVVADAYLRLTGGN